MSATTIIGNLFRMGWEEAARKVYAKSRSWERPRQVLVAPGGDVFFTRAEVGSKWTTVVGVLIGVYRCGIEPNAIEDDFLAYVQELSAQRQEAA